MSCLQSGALGLYISIPFCRSKCTYCNFASGVYPASEHARYVERLIADLAASGEWAARMNLDLPRRVDTVYLGGGTPSLLAPELLARLFAAMRTEFDFEPDAEITVECAPGQIADETLAALAAAGVNRVSLGVQSFIDREAATSGRLHSRATVEADLQRLRAAGIANLNVDLIAGLPEQTFASWERSLAALIDSGVPHASVYMLEVDEDSRLGREMLAHGVRYHAGLVPGDDAIAQMYAVAIEKLGAAGLGQYEISNFCRPGFASRHNLRYWQRRPYLGLGLDASSMLRQARTTQAAERLDTEGGGGFDPRIKTPKSTWALAPPACSSDHSPSIPAFSAADQRSFVLRTSTTDDLAAYLAGPEPAETARLSPERQHEEAWFLGLRLNAGVELAELEREFDPEPLTRAMEAVGRLVETGLLTSDGNTVRLTARGRLLSNDVFQEFLGLGAEEAEMSLETHSG
jgi:oxygen-independent coproporphyrinogen-3 oxidase